MKMDFRHADRADTQKLNVILWKDAMGSSAGAGDADAEEEAEEG